MSKFKLISPKIRANAKLAIEAAPDGFEVTISEPKRNLDQNALFHSLCADMAKSGIKWAGKERSAEDWKALLVSAHAVATQQGGEVIPGIEAEFVAIRESTSRMSKARASSLIEYATAFCASNGVHLTTGRGYD